MPTHTGKLHLLLIIACLLVPTVVHRISLSINPYTNFNPFGYNVPHLFTGILLILLGGIPLAVARLGRKLHLLASMLFAIGLSLALDEWVYLIATEGTDDQYLLPVSWWGAVVMLGIAVGYTLLCFIMTGNGKSGD